MTDEHYDRLGAAPGIGQPVASGVVGTPSEPVSVGLSQPGTASSGWVRLGPTDAVVSGATMRSDGSLGGAAGGAPLPAQAAAVQ